jgi:ADP-heptose:LPS heptosyltransferase
MHAPSWSLADPLDLGELAALVQMAPQLIANNTGPVHIAAARLTNGIMTLSIRSR